MQDCGFRPEWRLAFVARVVRLLQVAVPTVTTDSRTRSPRRAAGNPMRHNAARSGRG